MTATSTTQTDGGDKRVWFNYLHPSVPSSLYRNGRVLTRRDLDGSDSGTEGVLLEAREMEICDARPLEGLQQPTLTRNGFELRARPPEHPDLDFMDHGDVVGSYYRDCETAVAEAAARPGVDFFPQPATLASAEDRRDFVLLTAMRDTLDSLASNDYADAFANSIPR